MKKNYSPKVYNNIQIFFIHDDFFLIFPKETIDWSNEHKLTPDGTYLIYLPKSYYDSKHEKYIDTYKLVNEYQKNMFRQNPGKYPQNAYYTRVIPDGYKMKKLCGIPTIVSQENEDLMRRKNSNTLILSLAAALGVTTVLSYSTYKLIQFIKEIK